MRKQSITGKLRMLYDDSDDTHQIGIRKGNKETFLSDKFAQFLYEIPHDAEVTITCEIKKTKPKKK